VGKVCVVSIEQVEGAPITHQDDANPDRDRLRFHGLGQEGPSELRWNHLKTTGAQGTHQHLPRPCLADKVTRLQDQVTAVGSEQRSRPDLRVIAVGRPVRAPLALHGPEELGHGGGVFEDHRTLLARLVVEDHVDRVQAQWIEALLARLGQSTLGHVADELAQKAFDVIAGKVLDDRNREPAEDVSGRFLGDRPDGAHTLPLDLLDPGRDLGQALLKTLPALLDGVVLLVGHLPLVMQLLELLRWDRLALDHRQYRRLGHRSELERHQLQIRSAQLLRERLGDRDDVTLGLAFEGLALALQPGGVQGLGETVANELRKLAHAAAKGLALAGIERDQPRAVGL